VRKSDLFSTSESNQNSVEIHVLQGERQMAADNKSLGRFRLSGIPPAPRGVPQVQVSFDIDANGLLQVSATDRTTGRQQTVSIQGGSNLGEEEIAKLLAEAELKAAEDRRLRIAIDRRNRAQTLVAQAERRLRDAALELGPYGAERQQRAVEMALRDLQDLLPLEERGQSEPGDLELAVSQLQEALFGLNRRLLSERKVDSNPLQGLKNTLGTLKDELFSDDDWEDDWGRTSPDPWAAPPPRRAGAEGGYGRDRLGGSIRAQSDMYQPDKYQSDKYQTGIYREDGYREGGSQSDSSSLDRDRLDRAVSREAGRFLDEAGSLDQERPGRDLTRRESSGRQAGRQAGGQGGWNDPDPWGDI
jgi:molecular chaperone DnaK